MATKAEIGTRGEQIAADYLLDSGYEIIARNCRQGHLEIDIIARKSGTVHFVEVKTRQHSSVAEFSAESALNRQKLSRISRAAEHYINNMPSEDCDYTIDLITVTFTTPSSWQIAFYENVQWM